MPTDQPDLAPFTVALENLQIDARALCPLKSIGGLIEAKALHGLARDLDDPVAAHDPCFPRRAAADHADQA